MNADKHAESKAVLCDTQTLEESQQNRERMSENHLLMPQKPRKERARTEERSTVTLPRGQEQ